MAGRPLPPAVIKALMSLVAPGPGQQASPGFPTGGMFNTIAPLNPSQVTDLRHDPAFAHFMQQAAVNPFQRLQYQQALRSWAAAHIANWHPNAPSGVPLSDAWLNKYYGAHAPTPPQGPLG